MGVGPAFAIPKALSKAGIQLSDVDFFEINEAFASQAVMSIQHLGIPFEKVNPKYVLLPSSIHSVNLIFFIAVVRSRSATLSAAPVHDRSLQRWRTLSGPRRRLSSLACVSVPVWVWPLCLLMSSEREGCLYIGECNVIGLVSNTKILHFGGVL